jgi:hypothetical protein
MSCIIGSGGLEDEVIGYRASNLHLRTLHDVKSTRPQDLNIKILDILLSLICFFNSCNVSTSTRQNLQLSTS